MAADQGERAVGEVVDVDLGGAVFPALYIPVLKHGNDVGGQQGRVAGRDRLEFANDAGNDALDGQLKSTSRK